FAPDVTITQVLDQMRAGRTVVRKLTIPEGLTTAQVLERLHRAEGLKGDIEATPAEGALLPATYPYSYGDSRQAMLEKMTSAMQRTVKRLWAKRSEGLPLATPEEAVTLASIVEKETALGSERPRIAGVFINRLRTGMRLQADPTVIYAMSGGAGPLGRPLTRADLRADHPYNTYLNTGLPPGPIANPGRAALAAVLQPMATNELFFVADGSGGHAFARTYAEHKVNVARWREISAADSEQREGESDD
ncbi:MAG: endolytic transglycosylase MltG, partial [Rhodospirillales bacterium]|nr:endolytic transglycosylase MltG [Rhodospirillales bacterium]